MTHSNNPAPSAVIKTYKSTVIAHTFIKIELSYTLETVIPRITSLAVQGTSIAAIFREIVARTAFCADLPLCANIAIRRTSHTSAVYNGVGLIAETFVTD